jgi:hypothetical protein
MRALQRPRCDTRTTKSDDPVKRMIAGGLRPNAGLEPALLCLIMPGSLRADIIYSYAGNAFTTCNVPMLPVAILVPGHTRYQSHLKRTLSESALINLPFTNITAYVTTFVFTDAVQTGCEDGGAGRDCG